MKYFLKQKNEHVDQMKVDELVNALKIDPILAEVLCIRGIDTAQIAREYLYPTKEQLYNPFLFNDMKESVRLIEETIANNGNIMLYGDYDVDGTAGCAILFKTLQYMSANVDCMLPSRLEHGYGLSIDAVNQMKDVDLLITVDCGITNVNEIAHAQDNGIKTIITDHHECGDQLPDAACIINAKCPQEEYPYKDLCGAGVAFKLAEALVGDICYRYIDLAAIATIADIVPMLGENRVLATLGLRKLNEDPNRGLYWLAQKSGLGGKELDSQSIAFNLAPRMNAAGRIDSAWPAYQLMVEEDEEMLNSIADQLCELNLKRQEKQEAVYLQASIMEEKQTSDRMILLYQEDWDVGVTGLAASKMVEQYAKPALLLGKVDESYVGSARSIGNINIYETLASEAEMYEKFGGHAGAAGVTVRQEHLDSLRDKLNQYLNVTYKDEDFIPIKYYDLSLSPREITNDMLNELNRMGPFGHKNEQVAILLKDVSLVDIQSIGQNKHASFKLKKCNAMLNAVIFNKTAEELPTHADVVGSVSINAYDDKPQMIVRTICKKASLEDQYIEEVNKLKSEQRDKSDLFIGREHMLKVYSCIQYLHRKKIHIENMDTLLEFIITYNPTLSVGNIAFSLLVMQEIGLIEIKKSDRICIEVSGGKYDLEDSALFRKMEQY